MADKTLNITNNGRGTLTLGGVTIGNSSIATYNSSDKKISIVGTGTTNAAINLNYIKGSISKNFNRNFNILGKEDAITTFRNKVKALMEEYKYATVSGGLYGSYYYDVSGYTGTYTYSPNNLFFTHPNYQVDVSNAFNQITATSGYSNYVRIFSPKSFNSNIPSYNNKDATISLISEDKDGIALRYGVTFSVTGDLIADNYRDDFTEDRAEDYLGTTYLNSTTIASNIIISTSLYIDFYYPGGSENYKKYTTTQNTYLYNFGSGSYTRKLTFYISITGYSIQNLTGTVLTDRIINSLYS